MPPILPRKRLRPSSPHSSPPRKRAAPSRKVKADAFSSIDTIRKSASSAAENRAFLDALEDDQSSLSEADSDDFEDVLPRSAPKRQKSQHPVAVANNKDSDDELEFEDVAEEAEDEHAIPEISENFEVTIRTPGDGEHTQTRLTLKKDGRASITKKMRRARILAHCMHVQYLMWHNVIRNTWINDPEVQSTVQKGLPEALRAEVSKWKLAMGYEKPPEKKKVKKSSKGKSAQKSSKERIRDWGAAAEKSEHNMQADPLIRLLKYLAAYWKKRFVVTAPSLRKLGYRNPREMRQEMDSFNDGPHDPCRHGEHVSDLDKLREMARKCKGSRDVGAQLFVALLRGLGIEARMVASLQPTGFGWSKLEEAHPRKDVSTATIDAVAIESDAPKSTPKKKLVRNAQNGPGKGSSIRPINLDSEHSGPSSSMSSDSEDTRSPISPPSSRQSQKRFDRDLVYPTYWTEVLSPVSNTFIPVSTMVHPNVITSTEHVGNFEPRGAAAEKGKQVMAYVLAFSADGTAKDVTVRYLRKRQWPGKTKGFRIPVEKLPVYDRNGKVSRHEEYDWFKRVMRGYARPGNKRTLADDVEDEGDLIPIRAEIDDKKKAADPDTLQGYKQSSDFVLERHMRREEALRPGSKPVKYFHVGKGDKMVKEPVYKRSDIVTGKSFETWHKEGRQIKAGEVPLKQVAFRAVTLQRKREIEDQARDMDGKKPTQGLFAEYQTEWIIPDPIGPDRAIPRNAFNNIDIYVPSMVPRGAIHIEIKGTARVCKRLGIDYAEACTGFEFGKQRAVPVITGVVVAEENEEMVLDAWREDEKVRSEKESKKREEKSLKLWKKFLRGMKVRERIGREYGYGDEDAEGDEVDEWAGKARDAPSLRRDEVEEGGFLRDGASGEAGGFMREEDDVEPMESAGDGFFLPNEDEEEKEGHEIGFEIVGGSQDPTKKRRGLNGHFHIGNADKAQHMPRPISLRSIHHSMQPTEPHNDVADDSSTELSSHAFNPEDSELKESSVSSGSDGSDGFEVKPAKRKSQPRSTALKNKKGTRKPNVTPMKRNSTAKTSSERKRRSARNHVPVSSPYFSS